MFSVIFAWANGWENSQDASDLRRYRAHYAVTVMVANRKKTRQTNSVDHINFAVGGYNILSFIVKNIYFRFNTAASPK